MTISRALTDFANGTTFQAVLILVALDLILGVAAAVYLRDFRLGRLVDFARDDLLAKVLPWAAIYVAAGLAPETKVLGLSLGDVEKAMFAIVAAALVQSLYTSVNDLGFKLPLPDRVQKAVGR